MPFALNTVRPGLMAGSQHPGLIGIEEPAQLLTYQTDFGVCRRTKPCSAGTAAITPDIVYAARTTGVIAPLIA